MIDFYLAFGELNTLDMSTPNRFRAALVDPDAQFIHLIELYPYDDNQKGMLYGEAPFGTLAFGEFNLSYGGGITKVYLSDMGYTTTPTDSLPDQHFKALVNSPMEFDTTIMSGTDFANGSISFGSIVIENGAELDDLASYDWNGRRAVVKAGVRGLTYDEFAIVFDGAINDFQQDDDRITLSIQDSRVRTDQNLSAPLYAGTGDLEGTVNLAGQPRPLCYGQVFNIEPVLVDPARLIYQINDGAILSVSSVRDSGARLTAGGDVANILTASPAAGSYVTNLTGGFIRLGSTPAGRVTADVEGSTTGGYSATASGIVQRLIMNRMSARPFTMTDVDGGALARIEASVPGAMGFYAASPVPVTEAIDRLFLPVLAYWNFSRVGNFTGGIIVPPDNPTLTITPDDISFEGVDRDATLVPSWRLSVGYAPVSTVQGEDEIVGATLPADRAFVRSAYRYVTYEDPTIRTKNPSAADRVFPTSLANKADADAVLLRLRDIYTKQRRIYRVPLKNKLYRIYIGDVVRLVYPRYGLEGGKNLLVIGLSENAENGETILGLWG